MNGFRSGASAPLRRLAIAGSLLLAAFAGNALAVDVDFTPPPEYTPGDAANYSITISNPGTSAATVDVTTAFPAGVTLGTPACDDSNNSFACDTSTTSGNLDATTTIGAGESVVYTLPVTFAANMTTDPLPFNASVDEGGTVTSSTGSSTLSLVSDLEITSMDADGATDFVPGSTGTFNISVANNGPSDAAGVTLSGVLPTGVTVDGWSCSEQTPSTAACPSPVASSGVVNPFDLPSGGGLDFTLDVSYAGDLRTDPNPLTVGAEIAAAAGVTDDTSGPNNNTASVDLAQNARVDLAVSMTPDSPVGAPTVSYIPGTPDAAFPGLPDTANSLTVTLGNLADAGSETLSDALGSTLVIALAEDVEEARWTCAACSVTSGTVTGGTDISVTVGSIASGASISVVVELDFDSSALSDPLEITATATPAADETDTDAGNSKATNGYSIDRRSSITVEKIANSDSVNPLDAFDYTITVTNEGPSDVGQAPAIPDGSGGFTDVDGILLTDVLPQGLADGPSCPSDATVPCFRFCPTDAGAIGTVVGPDTECPTQIETRDGSVGTPGSPPIRLRLAAGNSSQVRLFATLGDEFQTGDTVRNTASIALEPLSNVTEIIPTPDDGNESFDDITVVLQTDLVVTKTDDATAAIPGEEHEYTITVRNDGNQTVSGVKVQDVLPGYPTFQAGFVPGSTTWQCLADANACCNSGTGQCGIGDPTTPQSVFQNGLELDQLIDLGPQTQIVFTVTGLIDPRSTGTLENTATAELPTGIQEENPGDNTATDQTSMVPDSALRISKELLSIVGNSAPFTLEYQIDVTNAGPSFAKDAQVTDLLGDAAFVGTTGTAVWNCQPIIDPNGRSVCESGTGVLDATVDIDVGAQLRFTLTVDTNASAAGVIQNTASVTAAGGSDSVTLDSNLEATASLVLTKTDSRQLAIPGTEHEYTITVQNLGPDPVFGARVIDEFPEQLENVAWSCEAKTPIPGDLEEDFLIGASGVRGGAVIGSDDGFHVYQLQPELDRVAVLTRNSVPGITFGRMNDTETETNGVDDIGDAGGVVENMDNPVDIALSPDQRHVYVLAAPPFDSVNNVQPPPAVVGFVRSVNRLAGDFGQLSFADSITDGMPPDPTAIAVSGPNVFVAGGSGEVAIFERSDASGLLTYLRTQTSDVPADPSALALDRAGNVLAVASGSGQAVALFSINDDDSAGTPIGDLSHIVTASDPALTAAVSLEIAPEADHLYLTAAGTTSVNLIRYGDQNGDGLPDLETPVVFASYPVNPPNAAALAPDGEHLLVLSETLDTLTKFRRDPVGGGLTEEPEPPAPPLTLDQPLPGDNAGLDAPQAIGLTSDGRHVLVSTSGAGSLPALAVYSRRAPDPLFELIEVDRNGDSRLTGSESAPFIDTLTAPTDVAVSSGDGQHVYVVSLGEPGSNPPAGAITVFRRDAQAGTTAATVGTHLEFQQSLVNGALVVDSAGNSVNLAGMPRPESVLVSPNGDSVYVTSENANALVVFDRDSNPVSPTFGDLTYRTTIVDGDTLAGETVDGLSGARGMAMDAGSDHLYVAGGFDDAVAVFRRASDGTLTFLEAAINGVATGGGEPVSGLDGVRDLAVTPDGLHVIAAADTSDAVVVFERDDTAASSDFGRLSFVDRVDGVGDRPMAVDVSPDGSHVYVAAQNSDSVSVLRRIAVAGDPAFGQLILVETLVDGVDGLDFMSRPRDVEVSPDGNRVYVAAQGDSAVLVFDRDRNPGSARFGTLALSAVSRDGVAGVDGLDNTYAVTVAIGSRNAYAIGFDDRAIASYVLGVGSICTGSGSGNIDDRVTIGDGGFVEYRITSRIRPDATGPLENTARVELPQRVSDGVGADREDSDTTTLVPLADLALTKTNDQVSVTAGEPVTYEIEVTNLGPSNLLSDGPVSVMVEDLFSTNAAFVPGSVTWSCLATGSGALTFVDSLVEDKSVRPQPASENLGLEGVAATALVADSDGAGKLGEMLATVGVSDDSLSLFARDPGDGALTFLTTVVNGDVLGGQTVDTLDGARDVFASADGRFLYVVSQVDDALTVFAPRFVEGDPGTTADDLVVLDWVQELTGIVGLDQPSHVIGSADGNFIYVAGSNDDAIAVFERDSGNGTVALLESEREGIDNPNDPGGQVQGLDGVTRLVISPDGAHLYAVSATARAVARFDRDPASGRLSWAAVQTGTALDVDLAGASGVAIDATGRHLYVTAGVANRIVALSRDDDPGSGTYGTLTKVGESILGEGGIAGLLGPRGIVISPDGLHVYAVSQSSDAVTWFLRDPATGALNFGGLLSNQSSSVTGLGGASGLVLDPTLDVLYVAGTLDAAIARFQRSNDSGCTASGSGDINEAIDIAAGGTVTFQVTATVSPDVGDQPVLNVASVTATNTTPGAPPVDPNVENNSQEDSDVVQVVADLVITKDDGLAEYDGLAGATAIDGTADSIYVAAGRDEAIGVFSRADLTGEIEFVQALVNGRNAVSGLTDVADVELSGDAAHLYAVSPTDNALVTFDRDAITGELSFAESLQNGTLGITGLGGATDIALSTSDQHLYVAGALDNSIVAFRRQDDPLQPGYGRLDFVDDVQNGAGNVTGLTEPSALAVSADGLHLYAVSPVDASIVVFSRNPNPGSSGFGALTFEGSYSDNVGGVFGLAGASDLLIAPNDEDVYVLGAAGGTLARFKRNASNGELAFQDFKEDGTAGTTGLAGASAMIISPDQTQLYVAATDSDAIVRFDIATDGSLAFASIIQAGDAAPLTGGQVLALDGVRDLLIEPGGDQLYSVSALDDAIATFPRDAGGDLDYRDAIFDGLGGVSPGSAVTYKIVVENLGPSDVPPSGTTEVTVVDDFPDTFSSVTWTCTASATPAAQCTPSGTGSINDSTVELPVGGRVTYEATGIVREDASGRLINTATVTASGVQDPVIANNSATDDDTVLSPRVDLVTTVDDGRVPPEATPGEPIQYEVTVRNIGPSLATDITVRDSIPPELFDVTWSCAATPVEGLLSSTQLLTAPLLTARDLIVPGGGPFAYAVGDVAGGLGAVVVYLRDSVTGELRDIETYAEGTVVGSGTPTITGLQGASALAVSADGSLLFAAGAASDSVVVFERDATSGLLTYLTGFQDGDFGVDGLGGVADLLVSPVGPFLYAAGRTDDAIAVFRIGASANGLDYLGRISQGDPGVDGLNGISAMAWDQGYLLAVSEDNHSLAAFAPSSTTGLLTPAAIIQNFQLGLPNPAAPLNGPTDLIMADDRILVAATGGNALAEFRLRVDPDTTPTPTAEFEFVRAVEDGSAGISGLTPGSLAWAPRQQRLYVASAATDTVHLFSLRGDEPALLAAYDPAQLPGLAGVSRLRLPVPEGPLYAAAEPGGLAVLARQRGSLCPLGGTRELGNHPVEIAGSGGELTYLVEGTIFPNATGTLRYEVSAGGEFVERELNLADNTGFDETVLVPRPDLSVIKSDGLTEVVAGTGLTYTIDLANAGPSDGIGALFTDNPPIHPDDPGLVSGSAAWSCSANPPLAPDFTLTSGAIGELAGVTRVTLAAGGDRLLATNPSIDTLLLFTVDPATGGVALERTIADGQQLSIDDEDPVGGLSGISAVAESRDGKFVYVVGETANSIVVLEREPSGGYRFRQRLESGVDGVFGLLGPTDVVLSPSERFVFVAATASDAITIFSRDDDTGLLSFVDRVKDGFGTIVPDSDVIRGVRRLHVSLDERFVYAVAPDSNSIATFSIDDGTGNLEYLGALRSGDPGVAGMNGAWDLAAAPGDTQFYVAGRNDDAIVVLARDPATGALSVQSVFDGLAGLFDPEALTLDASGSRLYAAAGNGRLHVFARDWSDGSLDFRGWTQGAAGVPPDPVDLVYQAGPPGLFVTDAVNGRLVRIEELALSRCLTDAGTSDGVSLQIDLGVDGYGNILYTAMVDPAARGELVNVATLTPGVGVDFDPSDNTSIDSTTVIAVSDIAVTKTGPAEAVAGEAIVYEIVVTNAGPSDALGIVVTDTPPTPLQQITWSCDATPESECPATGTGAPDFTATVRVGGQLTITMEAAIDPSFIGPMTNAVALTPEPGSTDPTTVDHTDSVTTNVIAVADVQVSKQLTTGPVVAGEPLGYRLTATNTGPSDAPVVSLADTLPAALSGATWSCTASGGANCPASGSGDIQFDADLPAGSGVEILVTASLSPSATGTLTNTFTATVAAPVTDPVPANNEATRSDPIAVVPDLMLALDDPLDPFDPAGTIPMPYVITLTNAGPSTARNIQVVFDTSDPVVVDSASCNNVAVGFRCATGPMAPGEVRTIEIRLLSLPSAPTTLVIEGLASTSGDDPDLANNAATTETELVNGADLSTSLTNDRGFVSPGEPLTYEMVIDNIGSVDAPTVDVDLPIAAELVSPSWTCAGSGGATCAAGGTGPVLDTAGIPSGGSVTYLLDATVDPSLDLSVPRSVLMTALADTDPPGDDINPANNLAVDDDDVRLVMFADGFESPPPLPPARAQRVEGCFDLVVERPVSAATGVLTAAGVRGAPLFRVALRRHADRNWVRWTVTGLRGVDTAGWQSWSDGALVIGIDGNEFSVRVGERPATTSGIPLRGALDGVVTGSGAFHGLVANRADCGGDAR